MIRLSVLCLLFVISVNHARATSKIFTFGDQYEIWVNQKPNRFLFKADPVKEWGGFRFTIPEAGRPVSYIYSFRNSRFEYTCMADGKTYHGFGKADIRKDKIKYEASVYDNKTQAYVISGEVRYESYRLKQVEYREYSNGTLFERLRIFLKSRYVRR